MEYQRHGFEQQQEEIQAVYVDRSQKEVVCPCCKKAQRSDRLLCYNCKVPFTDKKPEIAVPAAQQTRRRAAGHTLQPMSTMEDTERATGSSADEAFTAAGRGAGRQSFSFDSDASVNRQPVYSPSNHALRKPSVAPVEFAEEAENTPNRLLSSFLVLTGILGFVSGMLLLILNEKNGRLSNGLLYMYSEGGLTAHCLIYGALIGVAYGFIISPLYRRLANPMPVYAAMLFFPLALFYFTSPLIALTEFAVALGKFAISAVVVIIGIAIVWAWISGG